MVLHGAEDPAQDQWVKQKKYCIVAPHTASNNTEEIIHQSMTCINQFSYLKGGFT